MNTAPEVPAPSLRIRCRLGLKLEDYSRLVGQARSIPASPAKWSSPNGTSSTGKQEGAHARTSSWALCYAMVRNY